MSSYLDVIPVELFQIIISYLDTVSDIQFMKKVIPKELSINWSIVYELRVGKYKNVKYSDYLNEIRMIKKYDFNEEVDEYELAGDILEYLMNDDLSNEFEGVVLIDNQFKLPEYSQRLLCFSGEFDSNQTRFEELSNHLVIGVKAQNEIVGEVLLSILRYIIDGHRFFDSYVADRLDIEGNDGIATLADIIQTLSESESAYFGSHDLNVVKEVTTELHGRGGVNRIRRNVWDVDIWDIYRIGSAIGVWDSNERYNQIKVYN